MRVTMRLLSNASESSEEYANTKWGESDVLDNKEKERLKTPKILPNRHWNKDNMSAIPISQYDMICISVCKNALFSFLIVAFYIKWRAFTPFSKASETCNPKLCTYFLSGVKMYFMHFLSSALVLG